VVHQVMCRDAREPAKVPMHAPARELQRRLSSRQRIPTDARVRAFVLGGSMFTCASVLVGHIELLLILVYFRAQFNVLPLRIHYF
jgi:hypothetical protein